MKNHKYLLILCGIMLSTAVFFCTHEPDDITDLPEICFTRDILPVFQNSCGTAGCHDGGSGEHEYNFTNYTGIMESIVAGKPYESEAYKVLIAKGGEEAMPPDQPLPVEIRKLIRIWIEQMARETTCETDLDDDEDGVFNSADNCPWVANTDQLDTDGDGVGDVCDDDDNDGVLDLADNCPMVYNPAQLDADMDGQGNACDADFPRSGPLYACFQRDVMPILLSSCATTNCHDVASAKEDYIFTDYSHTVSRDFNPGSLAGTKLYEVITQTVGEDDAMPPPPFLRLTQPQIDTIASWILRGGANENCGNLCSLENVTFSGTIYPIIRNNCTGCHGGSQPAGGIRLQDYSDIAAIAASRKLEGAIKNLYGLPMPPTFNLSECEIQQIDQWIKDGALNN